MELFRIVQEAVFENQTDISNEVIIDGLINDR